MDQEDVVCIYTVEYYIARKNENLAFAATQMDLERIIMLSEASKRKTEKCLPSLLLRQQLTLG